MRSLILLIVLALPVDAPAQEAVGSITGRVRDTAELALGGVEITAQSPSLIRAATTTTNSAGVYRFATLPPGTYIVAFARAGLVPVKMTVRLSAGESAHVNIVLHQINGDSRAITVSPERQVYPPSWATTLTSRHSSLDELPVSGTSRSIIGMVTELPGARPEGTVFLLDGMPLRNGWRPASAGSFSGPGAEALQELAVQPGRLGPGYGRLQNGTIEATTPRGADEFAFGIRATLDGADLNGDLLRDARKADGLWGAGEYTVSGPIARGRSWFFASARHLDVDSAVTEQFGLARVTFSPGAGHRFEAHWIGAQQDRETFPSRSMGDRALSAAYVGQIGQRSGLALRFTDERGSTPLEANHQTVRISTDTYLTAVGGIHQVTLGLESTKSAIVLVPAAVDGRAEINSQALFIQDQWMPTERFSVDTGLRFERNTDRAVSPRVFGTWLLSPQQAWTLHGGFGRYVADPIDRFADTRFMTDVPLFGSVDEWSAGLSRKVGASGHARLDLTRRTFLPIDHDAAAAPTVPENAVTGMTFKGKYRFGHYADVDAQYTFSDVSSAPGTSLEAVSRHRLRFWAHTELIAHDSIGLLLMTLAHHRESRLARTDVSFNYRRRAPGTVHGDLYASFHVLNLTNRDSSSLANFLPRTYRFVLGVRF